MEKKNFEVERNKLDHLNVMKRGANEQSCSDDLWDSISLKNLLAQVSGLFNLVFIKYNPCWTSGEVEQKNERH